MPDIRLLLGSIRKLTKEERKQYPKYEYVVEYECQCFFDDKVITVPKGFLTDGSSGGPDVGWSWLIHDYLYATHAFSDGSSCSRAEADRIMYHLLAYERHHIYKQVYWFTHKMFSFLFESAWKSSGKRGIELLDI